jgi:FkbM family methyltransferase
VKRLYSTLKDCAVSFLPEPLLRPLRASHYRRILRSFTDAEEPDLVVVRHLVESGTLAVDIGANMGIYTKVLSELVGLNGRVISVEPVRQTFEVLSQNVRALGLANVTCLNVAISDTDGDLTMELPDYPSGGINFYQARVVSQVTDNSRKLRISAAKLDTLMRNEGPIGFVKCDVDGHELAVITGAKGVLDARSAAWLVEVAGNPDDRDTAAWEVFRRFEDQGYAGWWFNGTLLLPRRRGDSSTNYFFLRSDHIDMVRRTAPTLLN